MSSELEEVKRNDPWTLERRDEKKGVSLQRRERGSEQGEGMGCRTLWATVRIWFYFLRNEWLV